MTLPNKNDILKVLDSIEKGKIKATKIISVNATPAEKIKFNLCQKIIKIKRIKQFSNKEIAELLNVSPSIITRIIHCYIDKFTIDLLLGYYQCLLVTLKDKQELDAFYKYIDNFLKDKAA